VRDRPEVSYTELEFDTATEAGKVRLIFMLDENVALPIPAARLHDEEAGRRSRQQAFRKRLRDAGLIIREVASPQQLETELYQALWKPGKRRRFKLKTVTPPRRGNCADTGLTPYFAGRRDEPEALYRAFRTQGNTSAVQVISGLDKTRLAIEYAWRYAAATTWCGGYARKIPPPGEATMPRIAGRDPC
jgi:hypothetical protein